MSRVLFVSSHAELGGSERYLRDLLSSLAPDAVAGVIVLARGPLVEQLRGAGIEPVVIPTGAGLVSLLRSAWRLRRQAASNGGRVVHANGVKAALVCVLAGLQRVVWVKHDLSWDGRLARMIARRCRLVVGVSDAVLEALATARVKVVMPGVPKVAFSQERGRSAIDALCGHAGPVVASVGRIHPVKGHRELIEIGAEVLRRLPDTRFLFIGEPAATHEAYHLEMRRLADDRLGGAAVWTGYRGDLPDLMSACSAIAITTGSDPVAPRGEGFGYTAVEAMAVGTPVIAYDIGAVGEVLEECGVLVPPGERRAFEDALADLLGDASRGEALVSCGRARAATVFAIDRFVDEMRAVYEEVGA